VEGREKKVKIVEPEFLTGRKVATIGSLGEL